MSELFSEPYTNKNDEEVVMTANSPGEVHIRIKDGYTPAGKRTSVAGYMVLERRRTSATDGPQWVWGGAYLHRPGFDQTPLPDGVAHAFFEEMRDMVPDWVEFNEDLIERARIDYDIERMQNRIGQLTQQIDDLHRIIEKADAGRPYEVPSW